MPARQPRALLTAPGILVIWLVSPVLLAAGPAMDPTYDADGLTGLAVGGVPVLAQGRPVAAKVVLASGHRDPATMSDPYVVDERTFVDGPVEVLSQAFDPAGKRLRQSFTWGTIDTSYAPGPGVLAVRVDIENTSPQTIEQVVLDLLAVRVPAGAALSPAVTNLGFPALAAVAPRVTRFQRAAFPAAAVDDLLAELDADTKPEVSVMCPACYAKAAQEHLMETQRQPEPVGTVVDGTCRRCKAETHLPREPLIVATCPQPNRPLALAWEPRQPGTAVLVVTSGQKRPAEPFDGVWAARPIKPGAKDTIEVELRFGRADEPAVAIAAATYEAFARAHPQRLAWPDRRPISMAHLCFDRGPDRNPRGWWGFKDTTDDIRTPEGRAAFETWIMAYADQLIDVAEKAGAQGVVIWDLEGKQFPGQTYYGDPRLMRFTAPEMEAMADVFCAKLRDAGLRVGMCLRPTRIEPLAHPGTDAQASWETFDPNLFDPQFEHFDEVGVAGAAPLADPARSPVERLDEKIRFCKRRWGATLFYVDSNYFARSRSKSAANAAGGFDVLSPPERLMMKAADWEELQRRHPDVLLMPEHEYGQYWASTAPYRQPPYDGPTPAEVRAVYPEACAAIALNGDAETQVEKARAAYAAAVEQGDLLMLPGWYGPPRVVTDIYAATAARAPIAVELAADGRMTLQGRPVQDVAALAEQVAAVVRGRPFAERRTMVRYAAASRRSDRAAVIAGLERAGAVIAWSQTAAGGSR